MKFFLSNMDECVNNFYFSAKKSEVSHNLIEIHYCVDDSNYSFYHIISSFATVYLPYHAIILMFVLYVFNSNNL